MASRVRSRKQVAGPLQATLTPKEQKASRQPADDRPGRARHVLASPGSGRTRANDRMGANSLLPQAIAITGTGHPSDPNFVLAECLLVRAHMYMYFFAPDRSDTRLKAAKDAVDQALAEEPDLGEAHFALSFDLYWGFRTTAARTDSIWRGRHCRITTTWRKSAPRLPGARANGSRPWRDWAGRRSSIRGTRARRSSSARPMRKCAVTPRLIRPMRVPRSCPPIRRYRDPARAKYGPLEGRSRPAARYARGLGAIERRVSNKPPGIFRPSLVVAGLCDRSANRRGIGSADLDVFPRQFGDAAPAAPGLGLCCDGRWREGQGALQRRLPGISVRRA